MRHHRHATYDTLSLHCQPMRSDDRHEPSPPGDAEWALPAGTAVEVLSPFNQTWVSGFAVEATVPGGYRLRRNSDRTVLPAVFPPSDVRARS